MPKEAFIAFVLVALGFALGGALNYRKKDPFADRFEKKDGVDDV